MLLSLINRRNKNDFEKTLFKTEWTTSTPSYSITIPLKTGIVYDFDYRVNGGEWVNHTSDTLSIVAPITGVNQIDFNPKDGGLPAWYQNNGGDKLLFTKVSQWGTNAWQDIEEMFRGCRNAEFPALDIINLSLATSPVSMFRDCLASEWGNIHKWVTSNITNAYAWFGGAEFLYQDISKLDTSNITNMTGMLARTYAFNIDISSLDFSSIKEIDNFMIGKSSADYNAEYYDNLLIKWDSEVGGLNVPNMTNKSINMGTIKYTSAGATAHASLISKGLTITDGGLV